MFYNIIFGTSQTMTSKAVSHAHSKNNTHKQWLCTSNNGSALKTKVTMVNRPRSAHTTLLGTQVKLSLHTLYVMIYHDTPLW